MSGWRGQVALGLDDLPIYSLSVSTEHFAEAVKARQGPRDIKDCQVSERVSEDIRVSLRVTLRFTLIR
jgi:hypothetical protein